jgi:hypothetical protein
MSRLRSDKILSGTLLSLAFLAGGTAHAGEIKVHTTHGPKLIVYIDGEERGTTPFKVNLPDGQYSIKVKEKPFLAAEVVADLHVSHDRDGELTFSWANASHELNWLGPEPIEEVTAEKPAQSEPVPEDSAAVAESSSATTVEKAGNTSTVSESERIARLETEREQEAAAREQAAAERRLAEERATQEKAAERERERIEALRFPVQLEAYSMEIDIVANSRIMEDELLGPGTHEFPAGPLELTYTFNDAEYIHTLQMEEQNPPKGIPLPWALEFHHPGKGITHALIAPEKEQVQGTQHFTLSLPKQPSVSARYTVESLPGQVQTVRFFPEKHPALDAHLAMKETRTQNNRAKVPEFIAFPASAALAGLSAGAFSQTAQAAALANQATGEGEYAYYRKQSNTFLGMGIASAGAAALALGTGILSSQVFRKKKARKFRAAKEFYLKSLQTPVNVEVGSR